LPESWVLETEQTPPHENAQSVSAVLGAGADRALDQGRVGHIADGRADERVGDHAVGAPGLVGLSVLAAKEDDEDRAGRIGQNVADDLVKVSWRLDPHDLHGGCTIRGQAGRRDLRKPMEQAASIITGRGASQQVASSLMRQGVLQLVPEPLLSARCTFGRPSTPSLAVFWFGTVIVHFTFRFVLFVVRVVFFDFFAPKFWRQNSKIFTVAPRERIRPPFCRASVAVLPLLCHAER